MLVFSTPAFCIPHTACLCICPRIDQQPALSIPPPIAMKWPASSCSYVLGWQRQTFADPHRCRKNPSLWLQAQVGRFSVRLLASHLCRGRPSSHNTFSGRLRLERDGAKHTLVCLNPALWITVTNQSGFMDRYAIRHHVHVLCPP